MRSDEERLAELVENALAVGAEFMVDPSTVAVLIALQVAAMEAGCKDSESGMAWSVERGYIVRNEDVPFEDPAAFEVTEAGIAAARVRLGIGS